MLMGHVPSGAMTGFCVHGEDLWVKGRSQGRVPVGPFETLTQSLCGLQQLPSGPHRLNLPLGLWAQSCCAAHR